MITPRPPLAAAALAGLLLALLPVAAPDAAADERTSARPVPQADAYTVYATGAYTFPVLANDDVSFLSSGDLTLCGVSVDEATAPLLYAEIDRTDPTRVFLETAPTAAGQLSFTYDACQGDSRATETVTIRVAQPTTPKVTKKRKRRGRIVATNPNLTDLTIAWGSNEKPVVDGSRRIAPGGKVTIKVKRRTIYWAAYLVDQGSVIAVGDGTLRNIKKTKKSRKNRR